LIAKAEVALLDAGWRPGERPAQAERPEAGPLPGRPARWVARRQQPAGVARVDEAKFGGQVIWRAGAQRVGGEPKAQPCLGQPVDGEDGHRLVEGDPAASLAQPQPSRRALRRPQPQPRRHFLPRLGGVGNEARPSDLDLLAEADPQRLLDPGGRADLHGERREAPLECRPERGVMPLEMAKRPAHPEQHPGQGRRRRQRRPQPG
jgi:hypothetical protein